MLEMQMCNTTRYARPDRTQNYQNNMSECIRSLLTTCIRLFSSTSCRPKACRQLAKGSAVGLAVVDELRLDQASHVIRQLVLGGANQTTSPSPIFSTTPPPKSTEHIASQPSIQTDQVTSSNRTLEPMIEADRNISYHPTQSADAAQAGVTPSSEAYLSDEAKKYLHGAIGRNLIFLVVIAIFMGASAYFYYGKDVSYMESKSSVSSIIERRIRLYTSGSRSWPNVEEASEQELIEFPGNIVTFKS
ncbi:hypothetical protein Y032_0453g1722 [Ancylostoma ceylanicum]|nr:hypothetical protein Y032_0453g1722 [Ancylostoma ceylanicum]